MINTNLFRLFIVVSLVVPAYTYSSKKTRLERQQERAMWRMGGMLLGGAALATTAYCLTGNNSNTVDEKYVDIIETTAPIIRLGTIIAGGIIGGVAADISHESHSTKNSKHDSSTPKKSSYPTRSQIVTMKLAGVLTGAALAGGVAYLVTKGLSPHGSISYDGYTSYYFKTNTAAATTQATATVIGMALGAAVIPTKSADDEACEETL